MYVMCTTVQTKFGRLQELVDLLNSQQLPPTLKMYLPVTGTSSTLILLREYDNVADMEGSFEGLVRTKLTLPKSEWQTKWDELVAGTTWQVWYTK